MHTTTDTRLCASDNHCRAYDRPASQPAPASRTPLCDGCLTAAGPDINSLLYDYVDLEQLQDPALSQALNMQPTGAEAPPMPLNGQAEALQAEIVHVLTTWEEIIRDHCRLSPAPEVRRGGPNAQRALTILAPRLDTLANLPPTTVHPRGPEDQPADMHGWEAIHHLQHLHKRARSMVGLTHRRTQVPGACSTPRNDGRPCNGPLYRDNPRYEGDPCPIYCRTPGCNTIWTHDAYEEWAAGILLTPKLAEVTA
jgi:hypothetical protein